MKKVLPSLIALDVETTGLNPECGDRIVEIALIEFDENGEIVNKFVSLVNPERDIPFEVKNFVHGIDENMIREAPLFKDIVKEIKKLIEGKILVIHNADFDISFLRKEFQICGEQLPFFEVIDTLYVARKYFNFPSNSLSSLAQYLGLEKPLHRAENDAITAYEILSYFFSNLDIEIEDLIFTCGEI